MNEIEKNKLKHDFINSTVIINSISKSATSFVNKFPDPSIDVSEKQIELFKQAMQAIQMEISKIEIYFSKVLDQ